MPFEFEHALLDPPHPILNPWNLLDGGLPAVPLPDDAADGCEAGERHPDVARLNMHLPVTLL